MLTLMIMPNFKGTTKEALYVLGILLFLDAIIVVGCFA